MYAVLDVLPGGNPKMINSKWTYLSMRQKNYFETHEKKQFKTFCDKVSF